MPQASDNLRAEWSGPSDKTALAYLEGRGYVLDPNWTWHPPTKNWTPTNRDFSAMRFMVDEWDYGDYDPEPYEGNDARLPMRDKEATK